MNIINLRYRAILLQVSFTNYTETGKLICLKLVTNCYVWLATVLYVICYKKQSLSHLLIYYITVGIAYLSTTGHANLNKFKGIQMGCV